MAEGVKGFQPGPKPIVDITCRDCGQVFKGKITGRCPECRKLRAKAIDKRSLKKNVKDTINGKRIRKVVEMADSEGLSYGYYMAFHGNRGVLPKEETAC